MTANDPAKGKALIDNGKYALHKADPAESEVQRERFAKQQRWIARQKKHEREAAAAEKELLREDHEEELRPELSDLMAMADDGAELLDELHDTLTSYVALPDEHSAVARDVVDRGDSRAARVRMRPAVGDHQPARSGAARPGCSTSSAAPATSRWPP